jgi:hypothetical protein
VQIWNVRLTGNGDIELNGRQTRRTSAISQIVATRDYDPGAYVLLSNRDASCRDLKQLAVEIDEKFNCDLNYCFVVPE